MSEVPARPKATGGNMTISFGLVNVAVGLTPLTKSDATKIEGRLLDPESRVPVQQRWHVPGTEKYLERSEVVTGYEYANQWVTFEDGELAALAQSPDKTIRLTGCIPAEKVEGVPADQTYLVFPQDGGEHAYSILLGALKDGKRALVGTFVPLRSKSEKLLALSYSGFTGTLVETALAYAAAVKQNEVELVQGIIESTPAASEAEVGMAVALMDALEDDFALDAVEDGYSQRLRDAIAAKAQGRSEDSTGPDALPAEVVVDIMDALKASVAEANKRKKAAPKKAAAATRKPAARKTAVAA